jgi:hypothetical protein
MKHKKITFITLLFLLAGSVAYTQNEEMTGRTFWELNYTYNYFKTYARIPLVDPETGEKDEKKLKLRDHIEMNGGYGYQFNTHFFVGGGTGIGSGGYAYGSYSGNSYYRGSASSTSTTRTYDGAAAYQAQILAQQRMANFSESQWNVRNAKQAGYLKKHTIYPGETISGYVHIQRKNGKSVYVTMTINDAKYRYGWSYGK